MFGDCVADDFKINFPTVNFPYMETTPQNEEIWYNYFLFYEGDYVKGRDLKSYNHLITFEDVSKFEEERERKTYTCHGQSDKILVTNIVLLSIGKKDITDD